MERARLTRLRWRLRGAWQWPSFIALVVIDAVLLHQLPIAGDGSDWFAAFVLSLFFNLVAVAAVGPLLGLAWRRRRPQLPRVVAADRGGTLALVATTAILAAVGIGHRSARADEREELALQALAVARFLGHQTDPEYREFQRNIERADTLAFGDDLYRTCVPADDPDRALCLFVHTDQSPPGVTEDTSRAPNATFVPAGRQ